VATGAETVAHQWKTFTRGMVLAWSLRLMWRIWWHQWFFFICPLDKFMWSTVSELLECFWNPTCLAEVYSFLQNCVGQTIWNQSDMAFWLLGAYAPFYLKYILNMFKNIKNSNKNTAGTSLYPTCSQSRFKKINFLCGMCKKIKLCA
jgi:hypothetical protein